MVVNCPKCHKQLRVPEAILQSGGQIQCPGCAGHLQVLGKAAGASPQQRDSRKAVPASLPVAQPIEPSGVQADLPDSPGYTASHTRTRRKRRRVAPLAVSLVAVSVVVVGGLVIYFMANEPSSPSLSKTARTLPDAIRAPVGSTVARTDALTTHGPIEQPKIPQITAAKPAPTGAPTTDSPAELPKTPQIAASDSAKASKPHSKLTTPQQEVEAVALKTKRRPSPEARVVLEKANASAGNSKEYIRARLLARIARVYFEAGDNEGYRTTIDEAIRLASGSPAVTSFAAIATTQRKAGDIAGWNETLGNLDKLRRRLANLRPTGYLIILAMANEYALMHNPDGYEQYIQIGLDQLPRLTESDVGTVLMGVAEIMAKAGDYERALSVVNTLHSLDKNATSRRPDAWDGYSGSGLTRVAREQARAGLHSDALEAIAPLRGTGKRLALCDIALAEVSAGHLSAAADTARAIALISSTPNLAKYKLREWATDSARAWLAIGDAYLQTDDLNEARKAFIEAANAVRDIKLADLARGDAVNAIQGEASDSATIATACAAIGNLVEYHSAIAHAQKITTAIDSEGYREGPLCEVARARVRVGECRQAIMLVNGEKSPANQVSAYLAIYKAMLDVPLVDAPSSDEDQNPSREKTEVPVANRNNGQSSGKRSPTPAGATPEAAKGDLSGRWKASGGAEFHLSDDGKIVTVQEVISDILREFTGQLARRDGNAEAKALSGTLEAAFAIDSSKRYHIRITAHLEDSDHIHLRCSEWPTWNSNGKSMGTRVLNEVWTRVK